jgi:hypothetical protein
MQGREDREREILAVTEINSSLMPFTISHIAAVLPAKPFCPRLLSFLELVMGSIAPDLAYFFNLYANYTAVCLCCRPES